MRGRLTEREGEIQKGLGREITSEIKEKEAINI